MTSKSICDLFGVRYPVLQGGMLWLATAELAAAVSNAGGLGIISPYAGMKENGHPIRNLHLQIDRARNLTNKPYGVNIPLDLHASGLLIDSLLKENIKIVITAAGDPRLYTELLHSAGICVAHVISSVSQARHAESCKVDAVIAEGFEAGGRIGREELPLFSLLPQVVNAVYIPVIAAGGIADGRGFAAALALGAGGVQLGTRFVASEECIAHHNYKQAILDAGDSGTVVTRRSSIPIRSLKSDFSMKLAAMENSGASGESIGKFIGRGRARKAQIDGDMTDGDAYAGCSAGLIKEILPAAVIIEILVKA
ncbi:MAG: nitronate monooxygenase [Acidobacteria bacterium]|nr:nitronate monooxygenase [Acidobacteriota bacterium]